VTYLCGIAVTAIRVLVSIFYAVGGVTERKLQRIPGLETQQSHPRAQRGPSCGPLLLPTHAVPAIKCCLVFERGEFSSTRLLQGGKHQHNQLWLIILEKARPGVAHVMQPEAQQPNQYLLSPLLEE